MRNDYNGVALKYRPVIFRDGARAQRAAARHIKPHWVVMGEPGEFLIVCPADFSRLVRAGYAAA